MEQENSTKNQDGTTVVREIHGENQEFPMAVRVSEELTVNINDRAIDLENPSKKERQIINFMMALGGFQGPEAQRAATQQYLWHKEQLQKEQEQELDRIDQENLMELEESEGDNPELTEYLERLNPNAQNQEEQTKTSEKKSGFLAWIGNLVNR